MCEQQENCKSSAKRLEEDLEEDQGHSERSASDGKEKDDDEGGHRVRPDLSGCTELRHTHPTSARALGNKKASQLVFVSLKGVLTKIEEHQSKKCICSCLALSCVCLLSAISLPILLLMSWAADAGGGDVVPRKRLRGKTPRASTFYYMEQGGGGLGGGLETVIVVDYFAKHFVACEVTVPGEDT